ncbi:hypothetical protein QYE76_049562 [Lolium multiflorum]|uniref:Transposase (putative) gypsy type domain-containing protein n=1 Tax=Lolium multiflorum TaxID=4521 RepID=A0AAD8WIG2_LOLMU|nr:hypothetical protein QYE76_049562 [Lolium multiflorum]
MSRGDHLSESSSSCRESQASGEPPASLRLSASGWKAIPEQVKMPAVLARLPEQIFPRPLEPWKGSEVSQHEIDWLYRSRRIPEGVSCRIPKDEIEPVLEHGEFVVFLAHFEHGFGLPASDFFRQFLDFYKLQPHHLPGNAIFYLSCYATFMEAYMGLRPTRETFARFSLRINSVQGKEIPKPKPPVQCGSCIRLPPGEPFFKFAGEAMLPRIAARSEALPNRALDKEDPDPYVHWTDLKMGRTHTPRPDAPSASTNPQVRDHVAPLQAEVGHEFLEKLSSQQKRKAPAPEAGSSEVPPSKRPKKPSKRHYVRREMPTSAGPALKISKSAAGMPPESSEDAARPSPPPEQSPVPSAPATLLPSLGGTARRARTPPDYRAEEDIALLPRTDTGAATPAPTSRCRAGGTSVPPVPKEKRRRRRLPLPPLYVVPETSAPARRCLRAAQAYYHASSAEFSRRFHGQASNTAAKPRAHSGQN